MPVTSRIILAAGALALSAAALAQEQAAIEAGEQAYAEHCAECHGENLHSAGSIPDLRELGADDRARFEKVVREGRGQMPAWEGVLTTEEIAQIWAYIRAHAR